MYLTGFKEHADETIEEEPKASSLCNHYKRKIPKSDQDSPLISSTREDLGKIRSYLCTEISISF